MALSLVHRPISNTCTHAHMMPLQLETTGEDVVPAGMRVEVWTRNGPPDHSIQPKAYATRSLDTTQSICHTDPLIAIPRATNTTSPSGSNAMHSSRTHCKVDGRVSLLASSGRSLAEAWLLAQQQHLTTTSAPPWIT